MRKRESSPNGKGEVFFLYLSVAHIFPTFDFCLPVLGTENLKIRRRAASNKISPVGNKNNIPEKYAGVQLFQQAHDSFSRQDPPP